MVAYDVATKFEVRTNPERAREIMDKKIEDGRKSALNLFERVNEEAPHDVVAKGRAMDFDIVNGKLAVHLGDGEALGVHHHALQQMASRAGVPGAYLTGLAGEGGWQAELAAEILKRHYREGAGAQRFLTRSVKGEMRGFLSDKYRRLDSRPLVEAFAEECQKVGAVAVDGTCSDTRVALKALVPTIFEPVKGEVLAFGVEWANSDYGNGAHTIRAFLMRVWCLNGATMENALGQVHIGGRLADEIEMSKRTYELDTKASMSALRDVVRGVLQPKKLEALCFGIQRADENAVEWRDVRTSLAKTLLKGELDAARDAFEGDDVINLPAGKTQWRASNAVSWLAGKTEDSNRRLELQRIAGQMIDGRRDIQQAA